MYTVKKIYRDQGDFICRRCINQRYGANLRSENCHYGYCAVCPACKKIRNIVVGVNGIGKFKLIFKTAV